MGYDRATNSDKRNASFFNGSPDPYFLKGTERTDGTTKAGTGSTSDNSNKNWERVGHRELYSDFQNFMKRDWTRDEAGNYVHSQHHLKGSRFPLGNDISGLYPRDMNYNYKSQARDP